MFFDLNGQIIKNNGRYIYINNDYNEAFEFTGYDIKYIEQLLPYATGTVDISEIQIEGKSANDIESFLLDLGRRKIINIYQKCKRKIGIFNNSNLPIKDYISENKEIKHLCREITRIESLDDEKFDLVVIITNDEDNDLLSEIGRKLFAKDLPWLKVSYDSSRVFLGPFFFNDEGPCVECFLQRKINNSLHYEQLNIDNTNVVITSGSHLKFIIPFLFSELLKFSSENSGCNCFEREYIIDCLNYSVNSYKIYKLPTCGCLEVV